MTVEIKFQDREIEAKLADNPVSLSVGMRFQREGRMLFVFKSSRPLIDMMFVPVPLQLVFLDEEKRVVDIQEAEPWTLNPSTWKLYRPSQACSYLLESTDFLDVEEGDRLEFEI